MPNRPSNPDSWRHTLYVVIFEADTRAGKLFDVALIWAILLSIAIVMLESVASIRTEYYLPLRIAEWVFTVLFTVEYALRLLCVREPGRYAASFFGVVDLMAILPTFVSAFIPGAQYLLVIRVLRILRVFRVLKLAHHMEEAQVLIRAIHASRRKITVFLFAVFTMVVILGSLMYLIEGAENGFTSIPRGVYWAIVTLTTVGYGDISPRTPLGQALASLVMVMGYGIIAVPTGIVTAELTMAARNDPRVCTGCHTAGHLRDARHCRHCGARLPAPSQESEKPRS